MAAQNDLWVQQRIRWALKKHELPRFHTVLYEAGAKAPIALKTIAERGDLGIPVVCCIGDDRKWTLLATKGIASSGVDHIDTVAIIDIRRITVPESFDKYYAENPLRAEAENEAFLIIQDRKELTHHFWFGTHYELFAFWNILRRLSRVAGPV